MTPETYTVIRPFLFGAVGFGVGVMVGFVVAAVFFMAGKTAIVAYDDTVDPRDWRE